MKKHLRSLGLITPLLLLFIWPSLGQAQNRADTVKKLDALFSELNENTPGAALRVTRGNDVIYSKGFGMADLEHGAPVTDETIFEAGSVSKQFAATSILLLVEAGKVNLDDSVQQYIPEFPVYDHTITLRQIMNHTSGLRDWGTLASLGGWPRTTRTYTNDLALAYILRQEGLNNVPGAEYLYSNSNYTVLTTIVERVSGMSLPEFTRKHIFTPLGMESTGWRDNFKAVVPGRAIGYDRIKGTFYSNMPFENTYGHAALLTNVRDLDIWNKSWKSSPLGSAHLLELRTERGILNNGDTITYAAGVQVETFAGHPQVSHSGATAGYRCWLAYYPEDDLSVVYLSNATYKSTTGTGKAVAEIFFGPQPETPAETEKTEETSYTPEAGTLNQWIGTYYSRECGGTYELKLEGEQLYIYDHAGKKKALKPIGENRFKTGSSTFYEFTSYGDRKQMFISVTRARNVKFEKL